MTIQDISDDAVTETGRSDKTTLADRMAKHVVMMAHGLEYFPRDRKEENPTISSADTELTLALPTRFRKFSLIEPLQADGTRYAVGNKRHFEEKDPANIFSFEHEVIKEYYYLQEGNVILESEDTINMIRWLWYEYPDLSAMGNNTWIITKYHDELVDLCCYHIYRREGDDKRAKGYLDAWAGYRDARGNKIPGHVDRIIGENLLAEV